jgi:hypothetical protein
MSNPEFDGPITWDELVWALDNVRFPELGSSGYKTLPEATGDSAQHAATQLFRNVKARRAEASKWVMGALYADGYPGPHPRVYRRRTGGWEAIGTQMRTNDGELSTRDFKLLTAVTPEAAGNSTLCRKPFEPDEEYAARISTPLEDRPGWVGWPSFRATEGEH